MSPRTALIACTLALAGCANRPDVTLYMQPPAEIGLPPLPPDAAAAVAQDGEYAGTGRVTINPQGTCQTQIRIHGFRVAGGHVRFGSFSGQVTQGARLQMQYGGYWITGRFAGDQFDGRLDPPGLWQCGYNMQLSRIGP